MERESDRIKFVTLHSQIGPVWQNSMQRTVRTAHLSVLMTVYGTQYNTEQFWQSPLLPHDKTRNTKESTHTQSNRHSEKTLSSKSAYDCTTSVHNTAQNSSDDLPSYLMTNITARMLSIRGEEAHNPGESSFIRLDQSRVSTLVEKKSLLSIFTLSNCNFLDSSAQSWHTLDSVNNTCNRWAVWRTEILPTAVATGHILWPVSQPTCEPRDPWHTTHDYWPCVNGTNQS